MLFSSRVAIRSLAVSIATASCIATSLPKTPSRGGPEWEEIVTDHFIVDTDLDADEKETIIGQLEGMRNALVIGVFAAAPKLAPRERVFALRFDEFAHFNREASGLFINSALFQSVLVLSPGGDWGTFQSDIRKHELAHYVSTLYIDFLLQPRWFAEGLAGYLETIQYDEKSGVLLVGHHPPNYEYLHDVLQMGRKVSLDDLFEWDKAQVLDGPRISSLYQVSWAVIHYLADERPDQLAQYESALAAGKDRREAWSAIFPDLDNEGLARTIDRYLMQRRYKTAKSIVAPMPIAIASRRRLDDADVLGVRAAFYMAMQESSKRTSEESESLARAAVRASLELNAACFWAHQVNYAYFDTLPDSSELAERAMANESQNWEAWVWYADVLAATHGDLARARAALQRAIDLAPGKSMPLVHASRLEAIAGDWTLAFSWAQKALTSPPAGTDAVIAYIDAESHLGHCDEARKLENELLRHMKEVPAKVTRTLAGDRTACAGHNE